MESTGTPTPGAAQIKEAGMPSDAQAALEAAAIECSVRMLTDYGVDVATDVFVAIMRRHGLSARVETTEPEEAVHRAFYKLTVAQRDAAWREVEWLKKEIGRAHVCTPVTNAHIVCRLMLE